jgi:hypothetical protein
MDVSALTMREKNVKQKNGIVPKRIIRHNSGTISLHKWKMCRGTNTISAQYFADKSKEKVVTKNA